MLNSKEIEVTEVALSGYTKIDINNVAIWVQKEEDSGTFDWDKWIGSMVSPIEKAFFTYKIFGGPYYAGIVIDVKKVEKGDDFGIPLDDDVVWLMFMRCYYSRRSDMSISNEVGTMTITLDKDGFEMRSKYFKATDSVISMGDEYVKNARYYSKVLIVPVLVAISLMHCKNIELVSKPITRAMKRRVQRTGIPMVIEKVLVIEPFKRKVINEITGEHTGLTLALHICRGHFREYSKEKPLFGKYPGKYWIPQHARGNKESGEINKEYKVKIDGDN